MPSLVRTSPPPGWYALVTRESKLHVHHTHAFGLYDTKGLEVGKENEAILAELRKQVADSRNKEVKDQIHAVWYCVQAQGARFEDSEADFIREVTKLELPVLLVVTKVARREGLPPHPEAVELAEQIRNLGATARRRSGPPRDG